MLSCCLFKQTCRDESKSLRGRPRSKQILRDPYKFIVKTHFPITPLSPCQSKCLNKVSVHLSKHNFLMSPPPFPSFILQLYLTLHLQEVLFFVQLPHYFTNTCKYMHAGSFTRIHVHSHTNAHCSIKCMDLSNFSVDLSKLSVFVLFTYILLYPEGPRDNRGASLICLIGCHERS